MTRNPPEAAAATREICLLAPIIPVLVVDDAQTARPLAEALVSGGLPALEVTLRTPAALDAIKAMAQVPGARVGAGTLTGAADAHAAKRAGAEFGVSPGVTDGVLGGCACAGLPLLPGAATASEAMRLHEAGFETLKFFPAEASGGAAALKALGGPLPRIGFCPTGGIGPDSAAAYLGLGNVLCVGGSWVAPQDLVAAGDWAAIEALARNAAALARPGLAARPGA